MTIKIFGILYIIVFSGLSWYIYALYPYTPNLIFAIGATLLGPLSMIKGNKRIDIIGKQTGWDFFRNVFTFSVAMGFFLFFALNVTFGGSAASIAEASVNNPLYEAGNYYLVSHGTYTAVSYDKWIFMKTLEQIVLPAFFVMFVWNFIYIMKHKEQYKMINQKGEIK